VCNNRHVRNQWFCACLYFVKDMDGDHRVSFKDFQEAIKLENLLLQGFGQCLPDDRVTRVLCEIRLAQLYLYCFLMLASIGLLRCVLYFYTVMWCIKFNVHLKNFVCCMEANRN